MIPVRNIVVGTDFGDAAKTALSYGRNFARTFGARLHIVHVVDDVALRTAPALAVPSIDLDAVQLELEGDARKALDELACDDDIQALDTRTVVIKSQQPARALLAFANETLADLIIVGTHGRTGIADFFLGSVAQRIVRSAPCPVMTVRAGEWEFIRPDAFTAAQVTTASTIA